MYRSIVRLEVGLHMEDTSYFDDDSNDEANDS